MTFRRRGGRLDQPSKIGLRRLRPHSPPLADANLPAEVRDFIASLGFPAASSAARLVDGLVEAGSKIDIDYLKHRLLKDIDPHSGAGEYGRFGSKLDIVFSSLCRHNIQMRNLPVLLSPDINKCLGTFEILNALYYRHDFVHRIFDAVDRNLDADDNLMPGDKTDAKIHVFEKLVRMVEAAPGLEKLEVAPIICKLMEFAGDRDYFSPTGLIDRALERIKQGGLKAVEGMYEGIPFRERRGGSCGRELQ